MTPRALRPAILLLLGVTCFAQEPRPTLLGDFGGERPTLEDDGFTFDLFFNAYFGWNAKGGASTSGAERYSHSFDLFGRLDTEVLGWWKNGSALLQVKTNHGENINPDVRAVSQPVDDADFTSSIYVAQLYYEHELGRTRWRVGYLDYQTIVDRNAYANSEDIQFMSAAQDNNLLIPLKIGFGAALMADPTEWMSVTVGVADGENEIRRAGWGSAFGDAESVAAYGELGFHTEIGTARGGLPGNWRIGAVFDPNEREVYGTMETEQGSLGAYVSFDQLLWREGETDRQGLGAFFRWGWRDPRITPITGFLAGGFEYRGALPGRDDDALGLGAYNLDGSPDFRANVNPDFAGETGFELYYRFEVKPWIAITPDVQYIEDPGGLTTARDALVFVLRARLRF